MDKWGFTDPEARPRLGSGAIRTPSHPASLESTLCSLTVAECAAIVYGRSKLAMPARKGVA